MTRRNIFCVSGSDQDRQARNEPCFFSSVMALANLANIMTFYVRFDYRSDHLSLIVSLVLWCMSIALTQKQRLHIYVVDIYERGIIHVRKRVRTFYWLYRLIQLFFLEYQSR